MKRLFSIVGLLCAILLLSSLKGSNDTLEAIPVATAEESGEIVGTNPAASHEAMLTILTNELKNSTCLSPRTLQPSAHSFLKRISKTTFKLMQTVRIREYNILRKITENIISRHTINYSSFLTRIGYRVYALRKIII